MKQTNSLLFAIVLAVACVSACTFILGGIGFIISGMVVLAGLASPSKPNE